MSGNTPTQMIETLLGFARRSGRLAIGASAIESSIRRGRARLLMLSSDASVWTVRKLAAKAYREGIPVYSYGTREHLGAILGRGWVAAVAVEDSQFARSLLDNLNRSPDAKQLLEEEVFPPRRRRERRMATWERQRHGTERRRGTSRNTRK